MENLEPTKPQNHGPSWTKIIIIFIIAIAFSFKAGMGLGAKGYAFIPKEFKIVNQSEYPKEVDYNLLWEALDVVGKNYIEKPVDQEKVLYGAIRGAVSSAGDQYTSFFDPKEFDAFKTDLKGSFDGIGAEIGKKDGNIVIVAPIDDSPAKKAGLRAKDIIVAVNGELATDWTTEQAVRKIRGDKGTEVTLTIYREGAPKPFDVKIKRDTIVIKSVKWETKDVAGKKIGLITVSRFGDDTKDLFGRAVFDLKKSNITGLIIDLRNNPGGYLDTAVDIASDWVPSGKLVVDEAKGDGTHNPYNSLGYGRLAGMKTVVLINGGSASASEILSGALHDYQLATLIGEKSFGKGSVQQLFELSGGSAVKVTIAKWITPNGKNLNKEGLVPDIEVKLTEDDIKSEKDPQMEKALEEVVK